MSTTLPITTIVTRTPDDIALELSSYRDSIRSSLQSHAAVLRAAHAQPSAQQLASKVLLLTMGVAQQYLQTFMRTSITPSAVSQFVVRRPMVVGVIAATAACLVVLTGPRRLFSWAAKAATIWRIASAIRSN
jgi:hypothetical protein